MVLLASQPRRTGSFKKANRVLKPGGRLVLSDIISEEQLPDSSKNDAVRWALICEYYPGRFLSLWH